MENFEETVVNPNIQLRNIDGQLQKVNQKQVEMQGMIEEQSSCKKFINGYFLFAATTIIILLLAIVARA